MGEVALSKLPPENQNLHEVDDATEVALGLYAVLRQTGVFDFLIEFLGVKDSPVLLEQHMVRLFLASETDETGAQSRHQILLISTKPKERLFQDFLVVHIQSIQDEEIILSISLYLVSRVNTAIEADLIRKTVRVCLVAGKHDEFSLIRVKYIGNQEGNGHQLSMPDIMLEDATSPWQQRFLRLAQQITETLTKKNQE